MLELLNISEGAHFHPSSTGVSSDISTAKILWWHDILWPTTSEDNPIDIHSKTDVENWILRRHVLNCCVWEKTSFPEKQLHFTYWFCSVLTFPEVPVHKTEHTGSCISYNYVNTGSSKSPCCVQCHTLASHSLLSWGTTSGAALGVGDWPIQAALCWDALLWRREELEVQYPM